MLDKGYGFMPNAILFSKELSDKQKLLFCYISSLCAKEGFCRASNKKIGDQLDCSEKTISANITILKRLGFIDVEISNFTERKIKILWDKGCSKSSNPLPKIKQPPYPKSSNPPTQNQAHNNISNNTIINTINKYSFIEEFIEKENPQIQYQIKKHGEEKFFETQNAEIPKLIKDGYNIETIELVCKFIKQDPFRSKNILSMKKLREKNKSGIPYIVVMIDKIKSRTPPKKSVGFLSSI